MKARTIPMETTTVSVEKTLGQIQAFLWDVGATEVNFRRAEGSPMEVRFSLPLLGANVWFALPARTDPVFEYLQGRRSPRSRDQRKAGEIAGAKRAPMIAWRQVYLWIKAQWAMIFTGMVKPEEVFMPYMVDNNGKTFFEALERTGFKGFLLTEGSKGK